MQKTDSLVLSVSSTCFFTRSKLTWIYTYTSYNHLLYSATNTPAASLQAIFTLIFITRGLVKSVSPIFGEPHQFQRQKLHHSKAATGAPQRALSVNHLFSSRDAHIPKHSHLTQIIYCRAVGIFRKCKLLHSMLLNTANTSLGPFCSIGYMHLHNCCEIM